MHYKMLGYIEGRRSTTIMHRCCRYIRQKFFCHKHNFLETQIAQNKENHIVGMVEAGSECGIAKNVASQGMPPEYQVLKIIED